MKNIDLSYINNYLGTEYKDINNFISDIKESSYFYYKYGSVLVENYNLIDKFSNYIDWRILSIVVNLSEEFIRRYNKLLVWDYISEYQVLNEDIIRDYRDLINWRKVSKYQIFSEEFIREFKNYVDWELIPIFQELSLDFIEEFADKVYWDWVWQYKIITPEFFDRFKDRAQGDNNRFFITTCQPFIETFNGFKFNKRDIGNLYSLYQETKERGWFFGYIKMNPLIPKKFTEFSVRLSAFYINNAPYYKLFKVKVYWKDLKLTDMMIDKYEIIREVKYIDK